MNTCAAHLSSAPPFHAVFGVRATAWVQVRNTMLAKNVSVARVKQSQYFFDID
jgi:hypothetical protein